MDICFGCGKTATYYCTVKTKAHIAQRQEESKATYIDTFMQQPPTTTNQNVQ